jgi:hypothetical protein
MRWGALVVLAIVACKPTEENWGDKFAHAQCTFAKRCDAANFWYTWDDVAACEDAAKAAYDASLADLEGCNFDPDKATQCLVGLHQDCKEIGREFDGLVAPCLEVWDCAGGTRDSFDTGPI